MQGIIAAPPRSIARVHSPGLLMSKASRPRTRQPSSQPLLANVPSQFLSISTNIRASGIGSESGRKPGKMAKILGNRLLVMVLSWSLRCLWVRTTSLHALLANSLQLLVLQKTHRDPSFSLPPAHVFQPSHSSCSSGILQSSWCQNLLTR